MGDFIVLAVLAAAVCMAVIKLRKDKKNGGCCGNCSGCDRGCNSKQYNLKRNAVIANQRPMSLARNDIF